MAVIWKAPRPGEEGSVGHVFVTMTVTNRADQVRAASGMIRPEEVRAVTLDDVMVDTGATLLALPEDIIARLGLEDPREAVTRTAGGPRTTRRYRDVDLTVMGRSGTFDCLAVPAGSRALLGVTPMEVLGLVPDVQNHTLHLLPEGPDDSHIYL